MSRPARGLYVESWKVLTELRDEGLARSIGVSNFHEEHLRHAIDATGAVPAINQVELHSYFQQRALRELHAELGIATQAWSPLGQGGELLRDPVIGRICDEVRAVDGAMPTPAQVVLRWHLDRGFVTIPKSQHPARMQENLHVFDFALDDAQLAAIDALDRGEAGRIGPDPAAATF